MPKVGIIIPVYGVEKYIERCARSLFEQTLDDIEYLFIDDCTLDHSIKILNSVLEEYPQRKPQVRIHKMEKNSGQAAVREWGMRNVSGDYVIHCDSDDWVAPDMYQLLYKKAMEEDADIVCCQYYKNYGEINKIEAYIPINGLLTGPLWNKLVRRSLITNNEISYPVANKAEDGALMVQLSFFARKIAYIAEPLYYYFQNPESICRVMTEKAMLKRLEEARQNTELCISFLKKQNALNGHEHDIISWKKSCRDNLLPYYNKRKYRNMWRNTYPEINRQLLHDPQYSIHAKINFLMDYLGLRNIWLKIKKVLYK